MLGHVASSACGLELEPGKVWEKKIGTTSVGLWAANSVTTNVKHHVVAIFESVSNLVIFWRQSLTDELFS